jgi:hypothetical protein
MPMRLVPHDFKCEDFLPGLFLIGDCYPKADVNGKSEEGITHIDFTQANGSITGFIWTFKRGKNILFERITNAPLLKLAEPESAFLRLPGELRNKVFNYIFEDQTIKLSSSDKRRAEFSSPKPISSPIAKSSPST